MNGMMDYQFGKEEIYCPWDVLKLYTGTYRLTEMYRPSSTGSIQVEMK